MSDIKNTEGLSRLPLLALRGLTVFPNMLLHFDVGRDRSVKALEEAMKEHRLIFLVTQRDLANDAPNQEELYEVGTVCTVRQLLRLPGDNMRILVEGVTRARLVRLTQEEPFAEALVDEQEVSVRTAGKHEEALIRAVQERFEEYSTLAPRMTGDIIVTVMTAKNGDYLSDYIAQNIAVHYEQKQELLEEFNPVRRLEKILKLLAHEIDILKIEHSIEGRVKTQMDKNQRDYYLREQLKVISEELGESDDVASEVEEYREKILKLSLPEEHETKLLKEADRLLKMQYTSPESGVVRTYLDTCLELPWNTTTNERVDLVSAQKILDADHYGLKKVKDRILEMIAVRKLTPALKGQILCLVGPPGIGKTSVAKSVARAMNRKFARLSLGGVRDEADIRGHRKTYIGAMPGRIVNALKQAGSRNCVMLLDEIDKMGNDFRGDPAAALLEVLDTEQNIAFRDHFIELPIDLSDVLFITTANTLDTIPRPLMDRMEVIELTGYTDEEKVRIARRHLIPKQFERHGLNGRSCRISDDAVRRIIAEYTRESGVRQLEREIAHVCRKSARVIASGEAKAARVTNKNLTDFIGPAKFKRDHLHENDEIGVVNGLAWTQVGGEMLEVEVNVLDGSGKLELTGNLGDVMKESAKAALTYIRSRAANLGIDPDFYKTKDLHIHFPEGAIPKDGPSAGITTATAMISALTRVPVKRSVAMTGEITLRGRVLAIGGLKEKTMAAFRNGIDTVIIPEDNVPDLSEIDPAVAEALYFVPVAHVDQLLPVAFTQDIVKWEASV